jgi:hypothetical protein
VFTHPWIYFVLSNIKWHALLYYINLSYQHSSIGLKFTYVKLLCTCGFSRVLRHSNSHNAFFQVLGFWDTMFSSTAIWSQPSDPSPESTEKYRTEVFFVQTEPVGRGLYKKTEVRYFFVKTEQARLIKSLYGIYMIWNAY